MKSYQIQTPLHADDAVERITKVAKALQAKGHVIISVQPGRTQSIHVQPTAATRLLESVYTGQGWEAGQMYKSYAAVVDGVKVVWHKPMRAPSVSTVIPWPKHGKRRAAR